MVVNLIKKFINKVLRNIFKKKKQIKLGLYGPPNGGKTTLANKICQDWLGEDMGAVSNIAHETREIQIKEQINIKSKDGKELSFNLVDTPGIATKIDYEDFIKAGLKEKEAKSRAKEATKGVIDSIKWLDDMDTVVIVLDATKDPYSQVNITIIGNLQARDIPVLIIGLKLSVVKMVEAPLEGELILGTSLIISFLTKVVLGNLPDNYHVIIHPLGFAGWIGLLVTSLNLMPVGQLDGGHIAYAVLGRKAQIISRIVIIGLLGLGIWGSPMWLFWALLLIFLLGTKHPPPLDCDVPLNRKRKVLGIIMLFIFIITFIPVPFGRV